METNELGKLWQLNVPAFLEPHLPSAENLQTLTGSLWSAIWRRSERARRLKICGKMNFCASSLEMILGINWAYLDVARHAAGDDLLSVVREGDAEHHLVVQVVEYEALKQGQAKSECINFSCECEIKSW